MRRKNGHLSLRKNLGQAAFWTLLKVFNDHCEWHLYENAVAVSLLLRDPVPESDGTSIRMNNWSKFRYLLHGTSREPVREYAGMLFWAKVYKAVKYWYPCASAINSVWLQTLLLKYVRPQTGEMISLRWRSPILRRVQSISIPLCQLM